MRANLPLIATAAALTGLALGAGLRGSTVGAPLAALDSVAHAEETNTARRSTITPDLMSFADVAEQVTPAVVTVRSEKRVTQGDADDNIRQMPQGDDFFRFFGPQGGNQRQRGSGSGFLVDAKGTVLTNNHVVEGATKLTVRLQDGREFPGKVVGTDPKSDIAVVRIDATNLPFIKLGDDTKLRVGEWVLAIGSPFGEMLEHSVSAGIISAKGRANVGLADYEDFLQTDAAINPGNSGGPLVNLQGEVIGINTAIATRSGGYQGVGFAIPVSMVKDIMTDLMATGKVTRSWIGVSIQDVSPDLARGLKLDNTDGVVVSEVVRNSPASRGGLQEGDIILSMDGKPAESVAQFRNRVSRTKPGERVRLSLLRDGGKQTVDVRLEEKPEDQVAGRSRNRSGDAEPDGGGNLGLGFSNVTPALARQFNLNDAADGVVVTNVESGSAAEEAGVRPGDIVRGVNRKKVASVTELKSELKRSGSKEPVVLLVRREDRSFYVTLTPDS